MHCKVTHEDPTKVSVCKFTQSITQNVFEKLLKDFISDPTLEVFLLVFSMHGLQKDMKKILNHVRIIIESEESRVQPKLFVLLVHFPPVMFFSACYPTLFLNGWDHYYLDSITPSTSNGGVKKSIDIQDWSLQFCLPSNPTDTAKLNYFTDMLSSLLDQDISTIESQIVVANKKETKFNARMDAYERRDLVSKLLHNPEHNIGKLLIERFTDYWGPKTMNMYIRKAALYTYTHKSRLNLSDSIHFFVRSLFSKYLVHILSWMNINCGLEVLFEKSEEAKSLQCAFLQYLKEVPLPSLSDLELRNLKSYKQSMRNGSVYTSLMPFSFDIFGIVEEIADKCMQEAHMEASDDELYDHSSIEACACNLAANSYSKVVGVSA